MSKTDFAALLCSRLCHDLVSPVGAITNGIEILEDEKDPEMREQVIDLLKKSAQQTSNKLQFFRLAFGAAGGFSAQLELKEAEKALMSFLDGTRIELTWNSETYQAPKAAVKLLLNMCLVAAETLIRGGSMDVSFALDKDTVTIDVIAAGERIIIQDIIKTAVNGELAEEDLEPRTAPAFLAAQVVSLQGGQLILDHDQDASRLSLTASMKITN